MCDVRFEIIFSMTLCIPLCFRVVGDGFLVVLPGALGFLHVRALLPLALAEVQRGGGGGGGGESVEEEETEKEKEEGAGAAHVAALALLVALARQFPQFMHPRLEGLVRAVYIDRGWGFAGSGDCRGGGVPLRLALPPLAAAWSFAARAASAPPPPPPAAATGALNGSAAGACGALQGFFREAVAASGRKALQGSLAPSAAFLLAALEHRETVLLALGDGAPGGVGAAMEEEDHEKAEATAVEGGVVESVGKRADLRHALIVAALHVQ